MLVRFQKLLTKGVADRASNTRSELRPHCAPGWIFDKLGTPWKVLLILWVRFPSGRVVTVGEQSDGGEVTNLLEYLV